MARGVLAKFFAQRDFDVCEAVDGEDTIEKARKLKPDLILLDVANAPYEWDRCGLCPERHAAKRSHSFIHHVYRSDRQSIPSRRVCR